MYKLESVLENEMHYIFSDWDTPSLIQKNRLSFNSQEEKNLVIEWILLGL